uniref:Uncharacterized protein n=1 Tax=Streptomyces avermitilis TaxID=33903 RepID=A0A499UYU6_STRAX|nr:hypothetical protein SAVMC3_00040 [Streptomyces avermitilis]
MNSDFWSLLYGLAETAPAPAARLVGAYLWRHLARARADDSGDPFESGHLSTHSQFADTVLSRIAEAEPEAYVSQVLPFVIDVATAGSTGAPTPMPPAAVGLTALWAATASTLHC